MASSSTKVSPNKKSKVQVTHTRCNIVAEYLGGNADLAKIVEQYLGHSSKFVTVKQTWAEWPEFTLNDPNPFNVTIMSEDGKHFQDISGATPALSAPELVYSQSNSGQGVRESSRLLFAPSVHGHLLLITVVDEWYACVWCQVYCICAWVVLIVFTSRQCVVLENQHILFNV